MVGVPGAIPCTIPVTGFTVARAVLPLIQVPPVNASVRVAVRPAHTLPEPVIAGGGKTTGRAADMLQPVGTVYIILGVPAVTPVTAPVDDTTATAVLLLLHTPPGVVSVSGIVVP